MSVYPKPKIGLMVFLILVGSLSIRADVPLFTLTGRIINQDGSSADVGLSVKVSNQSKSLVKNVATDSDGNYRAIFIKTPEGSVIASLNDQLRVQVLDDQGQVIGSADHLITAGNLAQSFARLDVPIFISTPPVASNQSTEASEDTAVQITLTATDQDSQTLTYTVVSAPANGSLSGTAPNLTYRPNPDGPFEPLPPPEGGKSTHIFSTFSTRPLLCLHTACRVSFHTFLFLEVVMRQRTKITVSTQLPVELVDKIDRVREKFPIKLTRLFEVALTGYIDDEYPDLDAVDAVQEEGAL